MDQGMQLNADRYAQKATAACLGFIQASSGRLVSYLFREARIAARRKRIQEKLVAIRQGDATGMLLHVAA
jgi:hypothetical protein